MLAGFYTISSGLLANQKKLDVIGTNLVNSQTPGFRAERPVASTFGEALAIRRESVRSGTIGTGAPVTSIKNVETLFDSGNLKPTERSLDFAINGWGYFNVQAEGGENIVLTRNGQFDIDSEGYLILPGVGRVLGDAGPLLVESDDFEIKPDGSLVSGEGKNLGSLKISAPAEDVVLEKLESGMYRLPDGADAADQESGILQGWLELSNVDYNRELTRLIEAQRAFQSCSTALQIADDINQKAAAQIASL